jgi:hypothetical protein
MSEVQLVKSDNSLADKNNLTHLVTVKINSIKGKQGGFDLVLSKKDALWYEDWNTDDDKDVERNEGKTFALTYLISGVRQAYRDDKDYFKLSVPIIKQ